MSVQKNKNSSAKQFAIGISFALFVIGLTAGLIYYLQANNLLGGF